MHSERESELVGRHARERVCSANSWEYGIANFIDLCYVVIGEASIKPSDEGAGERRRRWDILLFLGG